MEVQTNLKGRHTMNNEINTLNIAHIAETLLAQSKCKRAKRSNNQAMSHANKKSISMTKLDDFLRMGYDELEALDDSSYVQMYMTRYTSTCF